MSLVPELALDDREPALDDRDPTVDDREPIPDRARMSPPKTELSSSGGWMPEREDGRLLGAGSS